MLGRHDQFALTRGPVTEDILNRMFGDQPPGTLFLCGDYSDATNEIANKFTRHCIKKILNRTGLAQRMPHYCRLAERSLCDNHVSYDFDLDTGEHFEQTGKQINAQPMGKILSFVCLCILNFAVCSLSMDLEDNYLPLHKKKLLVNGDDCVFTLKCFHNWEGIAAIPGLHNSIGKTFHVSHFIEINSISFLRGGNGLFTVVPYVNWGLMKGLVRSMANSVEDKLNRDLRDNVSLERLVGFGANHRMLVQSFPDLYVCLTDLFLKFNRPLLRHKMLGVSWFLPEWLGGLGLAVNPRVPQLSPFERQVAGVIYANYEILKVRKLSLEPDWLLYRQADAMIEQLVGHFDLHEVYLDDAWLLQEDFKSLREANLEVRGRFVELLWRTETANFFQKVIFGELNIARGLFANMRARKRAIEFLNNNKSDLLEWKRLWTEKQERLRPICLVAQ